MAGVRLFERARRPLPTSPARAIPQWPRHRPADPDGPVGERRAGDIAAQGALRPDRGHSVHGGATVTGAGGSAGLSFSALHAAQMPRSGRSARPALPPSALPVFRTSCPIRFPGPLSHAGVPSIERGREIHKASETPQTEPNARKALSPAPDRALPSRDPAVTVCVHQGSGSYPGSGRRSPGFNGTTTGSPGGPVAMRSLRISSNCVRSDSRQDRAAHAAARQWGMSRYPAGPITWSTSRYR